MLVMRALSLGLVKGTIDEVDESVHMTWVQPRVLNTEQVKRLGTTAVGGLFEDHRRSSQKPCASVSNI